MATGSKSKSKFSEADYQRLLENLARGKNAAARGDAQASEAEGEKPAKPAAKRSAKNKASEPAAIAPSEPAAGGSLAAALGVPSSSIVSDKKKRQGVKETPIMTAVRECSITVETGPRHIVIVFEGARLFTLNELLAILQFRKYIVFGYKKLWQELVLKALKQMGKDKPHFDGPCNVILFRQGAKMIDRDSFTVMFKYIIDALKDEPKKGLQGIFPDDNPDIVFSDEKRQAIGEPIIALRVELIDPAPQTELHTAEGLFSDPDLWRKRPPRAVAAPAAPIPAGVDGAPETPPAKPKRRAKSSAASQPAPIEPAPAPEEPKAAPAAKAPRKKIAKPPTPPTSA